MAGDKLLIIGIDGGTFDIILPLIKRGKLPIFKKLIDEGTSGALASTVPCYSPLAWTSFMTGKNPGKHGVFAFTAGRAKDPTQLVKTPHKSRDVFWNVASDNGKKICIVNVPFTYPPHKVNGLMISGFLSPGEKSKFTYPYSLCKFLLRKFKYRIDVDRDTMFKENKLIYFSNALRVTKRKVDALLYLLKKNDFDLVVFVFAASDRTQHMLWHTHDLNHPDYTNKYGDLIEQFYLQMDSHIGRIISAFRPKTTFVMSDHGGEPLYYVSFINEYLKEWGFLQTQQSKKTTRFPISRNKLYQIFVKLNIGKWTFKIPRKLRTMIPAETNFLNYDKLKTKVYALPYGLIFINQNNTEIKNMTQKQYVEFRNSLISKLKTITHNGKQIINKIYVREKIYFGPYLSVAPNLICVPQPTYDLNAGLGGQKIARASTKGVHQSERASKGIFIAHGENIRTGKLNPDITDLAPTILKCMNLPIPKAVDGKVLKTIFK